MFRKCAKGAETPRFRRGTEPPRPIRPVLRPCLADGKPATFHRWVEEDKALLRIHALCHPEHQKQSVHRFHVEGVTDDSSSIEKLRVTYALVEYPDGSVGRVKPELIQFLDRSEG
jgi:hypothetical protein